MTKKFLLIIGLAGIIFSFGGLALVPMRVAAVDVLETTCDNPNPSGRPSFCEDNLTGSSENPIFGPNSVLARVINILSFVVGIISVFVIIINALKLMTSMGDPTGVATARGGIIYASVAIVITLMAQVIVRFLLSKL